MRIDKFLWCVRLFKTRTLSGEQVRLNKVLIDEVPVKPSREVKSGDVVRIKRHGFDQEFEILSIPKSRIGAKFVQEYLKNTTPQAEIDKEAFLKLARKMTRQKGSGRPTKKDRRDMDQYLD